LPVGGALVVYDSMIDDDRSRNAFGSLSLNMLGAGPRTPIPSLNERLTHRSLHGCRRTRMNCPRTPTAQLARLQLHTDSAQTVRRSHNLTDALKADELNRLLVLLQYGATMSLGLAYETGPRLKLG